MIYVEEIYCGYDGHCVSEYVLVNYIPEAMNYARFWVCLCEPLPPTDQ
jgi:hypothetical protein